MSSSATVWVPILVAIVTGLVTVVTVFITGRSNLRLEREKFGSDSRLEQLKFDTTSKLERQKFESSLILQAIATGKRETAQTNLEFLVTAGFLPDPDGRIKELAKRPADTPVLPARSNAPEVMSRAPVFRWKVRSGADPDASLVTDAPVRATVDELAAKPRPADMASPAGVYPAFQTHRAEGAERTIYEVEAAIVAVKLEMSGSYHLTLAGAAGDGEKGPTMIASCVDPRFVDPASRWAEQIAAVYTNVAEKLHPRQVFTRGRWPARITGIGFFNQVRGQSGMAPNGLELTPVLAIEWLS